MYNGWETANSTERYERWPPRSVGETTTREWKNPYAFCSEVSAVRAGERYRPGMARSDHVQSLPQPRPPIAVEMRDHEPEICVVLWSRDFRFVEQDDLGCQIRDRSPDERGAHGPSNSPVASKDPLVGLAIPLVQEELEVIAVRPGDVDLVRRQCEHFSWRPVSEPALYDFLDAAHELGAKLPLIGAQDGDVDVGMSARLLADEQIERPATGNAPGRMEVCELGRGPLERRVPQHISR